MLLVKGWRSSLNMDIKHLFCWAFHSEFFLGILSRTVFLWEFLQIPVAKLGVQSEIRTSDLQNVNL